MATSNNKIKTSRLTKHDLEHAGEAPPIMPISLGMIPTEMTEVPQWLHWRYEWSSSRERWIKRPVHWCNGVGSLLQIAKSTDPVTWHPWETVASQIQLQDLVGSWPLGIGFTLTDSVGITCIDLDDCRDLNTGEIDQEAWEMIRRFNTYTEISTSGTGIHIFLRGRKPGEKAQNRERGVEIYNWGRYMAMTGRALHEFGYHVQSRQEPLDELYRSLFPAEEPASRQTPDHAPLPPLVPCQLSDLEIIERATSARNGADFHALWCGDISRYGGDRSAADMALASRLAFYCGPDLDRIASLMRQSGLRRDKYQRPDYLPRTIANVLRGSREFYGDRRHEEQEDFDLIEIGPEPAALADEVPEGPSRLQLHLPQWLKDVGGDGADLADNNIAARTNAAMRRSHNEQYRCHRPRMILSQTKSTGAPVLREFRCQKPSCLGCLHYLRDRENLSFQHHLAQAEVAGTPTYELNCTQEEWQKLQRAINRAGGEYIRVNEVESCQWDYYVVTTALLPRRWGAIPCTKEVAVSTVQTLLERVEWGPRPVSTSHGWSLPKREDDEEHDLVLIGECSQVLTPVMIQDIAATIEGGYVKQQAPSQQRSRTLMRHYFHCLTGWDDAKRRHILSCLSFGEALPFEWDEFDELPLAEEPDALDEGLAVLTG